MFGYYDVLRVFRPWAQRVKVGGRKECTLRIIKPLYWACGVCARQVPDPASRRRGSRPMMTFYGQDLAGNEVTVSAQMGIDFGNFADPS